MIQRQGKLPTSVEVQLKSLMSQNIDSPIM